MYDVIEKGKKYDRLSEIAVDMFLCLLEVSSSWESEDKVIADFKMQLKEVGIDIPSKNKESHEEV